MSVIAKGFGDRPYVRDVVRDLGQTVIVANPDCDDATRAALSEGVGFPRDHVFKFDSALSESLMQAWDGGDGERLSELWKIAEPYQASHASRG